MELFQTNTEQKFRLFQIASQMTREGIPLSFIERGLELGLYYEGVYELFELWSTETNSKEKINIIIDIQKEIDEYWGK